ncbi:DUF523 domain-containing protein [Candidatus Magnetomoraceae bacterium gMMP-13]
MTCNSKILISACLFGQKTRYDAKSNPIQSHIIEKLKKQGRLIPFCPERAGGLPTPRPPAEIIGKGGEAVLCGKACVINTEGHDVTHFFINGAKKALAKARQHDIKTAVLKNKSPSCGITEIYDGSFSGNKKSGKGVTSALLKSYGVQIFNEDNINWYVIMGIKL